MPLVGNAAVVAGCPRRVAVGVDPPRGELLCSGAVGAHDEEVREVIRQKEKRVSDDFINALSDHVLHTVERAVQRASANGRSTLRPEDI